MAKITMVCPFSKELCRDCPVYRGRHYYCCFDAKHQGCLDKRNETKERTELRGVRKFEMPLYLSPSPTWLILNKLVERKYSKLGDQ